MERNKVIPVFFLSTALFLAATFHGYGAENAYRYDSYGRRDPFVPLLGVPANGPSNGVLSILTIDDVSLQGILVEPDGKRSVVINGEILREGDRMARVFIEAIGENVVTIHIDDVKYEVKLYE